MSKTNVSPRGASGVAAVLLSGLLLSACGGSSDSGAGVPGGPGGATPGPVSSSPQAPAAGAAEGGGGSVPAQASSSMASMMAWAKSLGTSDTDEPMRTNTFRPPLDETTETSPG